MTDSPWHRMTHTFIAPSLADCLARGYPAGPRPWQARALAELEPATGPVPGALVVAPTASGKTLLAEIAALRAVSAGRGALFLEPTRALAEERAAGLAQRYAPAGIRVACSTRDRRTADAAIARGDVPITVAVYEKGMALLSGTSPLAAATGVIVCDEIQLLADPHRGGAVDLMLTRWRRSDPSVRPRLVALSAVVGEPERLASWLGLRLWRGHDRPAPLHEGVLDLSNGVFRWRDVETGEEGQESLASPIDPHEEGDLLPRARAVVEIARQHGPLILFCATRHQAVTASQALAELRPFPPAAEALEALESLPPDTGKEWFTPILSQGVGLHTADVLGPVRGVVEQAFHRGELPILVATPTLDQGIDARAATVIVSPRAVGLDPLTGAPALVPAPRTQIINQAGRAGRHGSEPGRAILLASNDVEAWSLWEQQAGRGPEPLTSPLLGGDLLAPIASALTDRPGASGERVADLLRESFAGREREPMSLLNWVQRELAAGAADGFWQCDGAGWRITALGELLARSGVRPATLRTWTRLMAEQIEPEPGRESERPGEPSTAAWLFLLGLGEDWEDRDVRVGRGERRARQWPSGLEDRLGRGGGIVRALRAMLCGRGGSPMRHHLAARRALLLDDWLAGESLAELERMHGVSAGTACRMAATGAWLAGAAADCASACGLMANVMQAFEEMAEQLARLAQRDSAAGEELDEPAEAAEVVEEEEASPEPGESPAPAAGPPTLRFPAGDPGVVIWQGRRIALTPMAFQLLEFLARTPGRVVPYRELTDHLWPDAKVEDQQLNYHRRRLRAALGADAGVITSRYGWGLILNLPAEHVVFEPAAVLRESA